MRQDVLAKHFLLQNIHTGGDSGGMDSGLYPLPEIEKAEGPKATSSPAASQRSSPSPSESASSRDTTVDKFRSEKESKIRDACRWRDLDHLRALATTEDGFLCDKLRHLACKSLLRCIPHLLMSRTITGSAVQLRFNLFLILVGPILLGCGCRDGNEDVHVERSNEGDQIAEKGTTDNRADTIFPPWKELPPHPDEDQVRLDVDRSFVYYPIGMACSLT